VTRDEDFLSRWSRRKHAARRADLEEPVSEPPPVSAEPTPTAAREAPPEQPLPPVESLTPESDFTPFMQEGVDPGLRRQALRTLFRDPRFNAMDGLDVYIDDYSKPDPIPPHWLGKLSQMARLGDYQPPEASADEAPPPPEGVEIGKENQEVAIQSDDPQAANAADASPDPDLKGSDL
jgi:hypothetical protein